MALIGFFANFIPLVDVTPAILSRDYKMAQ